MGNGAWKSAEWALENVPGKDASDTEWEAFAIKSIEFCEQYKDEPEYELVCRNIKRRIDEVFEGVPIIQNEPVKLSKEFTNGTKKK